MKTAMLSSHFESTIQDTGKDCLDKKDLKIHKCNQHINISVKYEQITRLQTGSFQETIVMLGTAGVLLRTYVNTNRRTQPSGCMGR